MVGDGGLWSVFGEALLMYCSGDRTAADSHSPLQLSAARRSYPSYT